ncbi:hypothetical protein HMPREF9554_02478 [Treponema phagedenis F0421]|nr:hypothetical protein HMPREF9554_02478 [Treponema phagedenis F0421]
MVTVKGADGSADCDCARGFAPAQLIASITATAATDKKRNFFIKPPKKFALCCNSEFFALLQTMFFTILLRVRKRLHTTKQSIPQRMQFVLKKYTVYAKILPTRDLQRMLRFDIRIKHGTTPCYKNRSINNKGL